ncbi:MAG: alcohol dehydrogenase catalytic domain-containing protein [Candidatus Methylomirabilales bacterium]
MRAIVKTGEGPGIALQDIPRPEPQPGEVLVRVRATAICGTDLHIAEWNAWAQGAGIRLPLILGHEFAGHVAALGREVRGLREGDYVAGETHLACGACYQCTNGLPHICANLRLFGIHRDGCFAEYATIPARYAVPVSAAIPPRVAAMLEPLGTALRAVRSVDVAGAAVLVLGCGPIGLFAIAAARALGASCVIGLDVRQERLALAARLGCHLALDARRPDVPEQVRAATDGRGADALVEASGSGPALERAFRLLRKGCRCALVGLPSTPVALNLGPDVIFKEATPAGATRS